MTNSTELWYQCLFVWGFACSLQHPRRVICIVQNNIFRIFCLDLSVCTTPLTVTSTVIYLWRNKIHIGKISRWLLQNAILCACMCTFMCVSLLFTWLKNKIQPLRDLRETAFPQNVWTSCLQMLLYKPIICKCLIQMYVSPRFCNILKLCWQGKIYAFPEKTFWPVTVRKANV